MSRPIQDPLVAAYFRKRRLKTPELVTPEEQAAGCEYQRKASAKRMSLMTPEQRAAENAKYKNNLDPVKKSIRQNAYYARKKDEFAAQRLHRQIATAYKNIKKWEQNLKDLQNVNN